MNRTILNEIVSRVVARENCEKSGNTEWHAKHSAELRSLEKELPHGSGFDVGTKIDLAASSRNKLVLTTGFHHMNDAGMYDGWTDHRVTVTPDLLSGFNLSISGQDRNEIKEYMHAVFTEALSAQYAGVAQAQEGGR